MILEEKYPSIESEYLDLIRFFKDFYEYEKPKTLAAIERRRIQIAYWSKAEKTLRNFIKCKAIENITDEDRKNQLWDKLADVECPECKTKSSLRPVGEINLDDGLPYFQYYCWNCYLNFEAKKPNNTDALIVYYRNIIEDNDIELNKNNAKEYHDTVNHIKSLLGKMESLSAKRKMNKEEVKIRSDKFLEFLTNDIVRLRDDKHKMLAPKLRIRKLLKEKLLQICEWYIEWYEKRLTRKFDRKSKIDTTIYMDDRDYRLFK